MIKQQWRIFVLASVLAADWGGNSAQAQNTIPFFITSNASADLCFAGCIGPWSRSTGFFNLVKGTQHYEFYDAAINAFSPFGSWECSFQKGLCTEISAQTPPVPFTKIDFCVDARPGITTDGVKLLATDTQYIVNGGPPPCNSTDVAGLLGQEREPGQLDRGRFRFDGQAGDQVTVKVDRDPANGSTGKMAQLSLRSQHGETLDQRKGALPLELTVTLPSTGSYVSEVTEVADDEAFRGYYRLSVKSSNSKAGVLLGPLPSTEP